MGWGMVGNVGWNDTDCALSMGESRLCNESLAFTQTRQMHEATLYEPALMDGSKQYHQTFSLYNMEAEPREAGALQVGFILAQSHTHLTIVSGLITRPFKTQINTSCASNSLY